MFRLGLTGGIGSGKSTVAQMLAQRGAVVIDADAQSHALTGAGGAAMAALEQAFGPQVVAPDGSLDRASMRQIVFTNPEARRQLEGILHPLIGQRIAQQEAAAQAAGRPCVVFDVPLLLESERWRRRVDRVLVVDCRPETQVQRVMQRSGLDVAAIEKIMATQLPRWRRLRGADHVLFNDGVSLTTLEAELQQLAPQFGL